MPAEATVSLALLSVGCWCWEDDAFEGGGEGVRWVGRGRARLWWRLGKSTIIGRLAAVNRDSSGSTLSLYTVCLLRAFSHGMFLTIAPQREPHVVR